VPAKKKPVIPETVKVRVAVMVDKSGAWACWPVEDPNGDYDQATRDADAFNDCSYDISDPDSAARYVVTAELAVPKGTLEVPGSAEKPAEPEPKPAKKGKK